MGNFYTDRTKLQVLYTENSILSFEGERFFGAALISEKLNNFQFKAVRHHVVTADALPGPVAGSIVVFVCGHLFVDDGANPLSFSQCFQLLPHARSDTLFLTISFD